MMETRLSYFNMKDMKVFKFNFKYKIYEKIINEFYKMVNFIFTKLFAGFRLFLAMNYLTFGPWP